MPKVLIADSLSPRAAEILHERGLDVDVKTGLTPTDLMAIVGDYDGLAVRSATKVTADIINVAERLKVIGRAGIGVDTIDVEAATARGIAVMNTPAGNTITTAEHTLALMMALARQIPQAHASVTAGKWERGQFMGTELAGKTLGVVGCGNIGALVAERAQGLGMRVAAHDPYLTAERAEALGVERLDLDTLLSRADVITLHVPLTDDTRRMIDAAALAKTRPGVLLINCARGGLVVEADLAEALESGQVAGAALDVYENEPPTDSPLLGMDSVVLTPHLGASTEEAQFNVAVQIAEQIADFLLSGTVVNAVNLPSVSAEEAPVLRPYLRLAELLGSFAGQIVESGISAVAIAYEGQTAALNTRSLTAALLSGLLSPVLDEVNPVNAPVIARQRGIDVSEITRESAGQYQRLIKLAVKTETRTWTVAGTLFDAARPRLVEVQGISMDAQLGTHMLFVASADRPGMIGALGLAFGELGVNIATFQLGRDRPSGTALSLIESDQPIPETVVAKVRSLPPVTRVKALRF